MRPYLFSVSAYISCTFFASLTSAAKKNAARQSDAVFSPASRPTSATHTRAPSDEKRSAASRPMPPPAPVMTATFPSSLPTLEQPLPLIAGNYLVEQGLLGARVVQVVVDDVVAERLAGHPALLEARDGVTQCVGETLHVRLVGVALELGREGQLLLDAAEARRQEGGETEVRVHVRARDPRLGAQVLAVADDAEAARPVVVAPRERRRRPRTGGVALV